MFQAGVQHGTASSFGPVSPNWDWKGFIYLAGIHSGDVGQLIDDVAT